MAVKRAAAPVKSTKTPFSELKGLTNQQLFDLVNAYSGGQFNRAISKGTNTWFTQKGVEMLSPEDLKSGGILNEFLNQTFKFAFEKYDMPRVNTKWEKSGIVETYSHGEGGVFQRIAGQIYPEVTPGFLPENAKSKDPDKYSPFKPRYFDEKERFSVIGNDNFQNVISYQDFAIKPSFLTERGLSGYVSLKANGVYRSYDIHEEVFLQNVFMKAIKSEKYPLRDSQVITIDGYPTGAGAEATEAQSKALFNRIRKTMHLIENNVGVTGEFNAAGYESSWTRDDFVLLLRTGIEDDAITNIPTEFYRDSAFAFPFSQITTMNDFGGIEPYADADFTQKLYPVYSDDGWGSIVANTYNTTEGTTVDNTEGQIVDDGTNVHFKDTNSDILGFIVQKGYIFRERQNGLIANVAYNPRTLANNLIVSAPNNAVNSDYYYNVIVIKAGNAPA